MFFVDGKVGGALSDFFGVTKPEEKRLRAILKLVNALPAGCGAAQPSNSPEFQKWQELVTANQPTVIEPSVKPAAEVALNPPLRMQIDNLRFSRDGKYILAQDESSVTVLTRDPYKPLFRFDAESALPAEFSPDSQHIVFHTPGLHTEDWSIPDQKLAAAHELNTQHRCAQSKLSPDGRTLFCISFDTELDFDAGEELITNLDVLDTETGKVLYEKKHFFVPSYGFYLEFLLSQELGMITDFIPSSVSADGNFMLIGPSEEKLAFDLRSRTVTSIGKDLKNNINGAYAFVGNDKVIGVAKADVKDSGIFSFPEGKRVNPVPIGLTDLGSVSSGNYVLSHNIQDYAVGLVDVSAAKFVVASKAPSIDIWDGSLLNENADGTVVLHKLGDKTVPDQSATLPISPLGPGLVTATSGDGRYLAISTRTRGGVWDTTTGERVLLAQRFNSAVFAPDNTVYIEFAKQDKQDRSIVHFNFFPFSATPVSYKEEKNAQLTHSGLQEWKRSEDRKSVEVIVHDVKDNSVLWRQTYAAAQFAHTSSTIVPDEIIAAFLLKSDFAKARLADNPALAAQAAQIKSQDKGGLVQVLDSRTGKVLHEVVLEIPLDYEGLQGIHVFGDSLYLTGRANRTIVYSLATGKQVRQVFGTLIAADPASNRICLINRRDEALVYNAQGQLLADFEMGSPIRLATFGKAGERLLLLTADQKVRTMAISTGAATADDVSAEPFPSN